MIGRSSRDKKAVDLAVGGTRVSRVRRDPPPPPRKVTAGEVRAVEARTVAIGMIVFALAVVVILVSLARGAGWSPSHYVVSHRSAG